MTSTYYSTNKLLHFVKYSYQGGSDNADDHEAYSPEEILEHQIIAVVRPFMPNNNPITDYEGGNGWHLQHWA